jgi:hypothetical protein
MLRSVSLNSNQFDTKHIKASSTLLSPINAVSIPLFLLVSPSIRCSFDDGNYFE